MAFILFWFALAIIVGVLASNRGRNGFGWFLLTCFISPILGGLFLLASPNLQKEAIEKERHAEILRALGGKSLPPPRPTLVPKGKRLIEM